MSSEQRYGRLRDLLDLAVALQGSLHGLSVRDVAARYDVSERTAHRMLSALREGFGEHAFEHEDDDERLRRWRLVTAPLSAAVHFTQDDLATLDAAAKQARRGRRRAEARALTSILERIRTLDAATRRPQVETDLDVIFGGQDAAMRPGPRARVEPAVVQALRHALLAGRRVELAHRHQGAAIRRHRISPLGFLTGERPYLVAHHKPRGVLLYRLARITDVEILDEASEVPARFDLVAYAERSFGVFQEEPVDVAWRFSAAAAPEAREFEFHPTQRVEEQADGSLVVRFRAGGLREMAWHLFTWGAEVEVLEPPALRRELERLCAEVLHAQSKTPRRAAARTVAAPAAASSKRRSQR